MSRYRLVLGVSVVLVAAIIGVVAVYQPSPPDPTGGDGSTGGALLAVDQRQPAPELTGISGWVNSPPLQLLGHRKGVTLIDFWTFSCVNCTRTIPHLQALYASYRSRGLQIIGVHSPEFDFEKDPGNVRDAVRRLGVTWPVAMDSDMATWNAFGNQYWPAEYLVDQQGRVAYVHFGEGEYDKTDAAVRALVGAPDTAASAPTATAPPADVSPELYAGAVASSEHHTGLGDGEQLTPRGVSVFADTAAPATQRDAIELTGSWSDHGTYVEATTAGHVRLRFHAHELYAVAGSRAGSLTVPVRLDGAAVNAHVAGTGLSGGSATVARSDLFHLLTAVDPGDHVIDLAVPPGFQLYTFTFG